MLENSTASDTLEGIVQWWMLDQEIKQNVSDVKAVLDELAAKQLVIVSRKPDNKIHYRINRRKQKEILALLKKPR
jgi:hypothetical protein